MYGTSDVALAKAACGGVGWVGGGMSLFSGGGGSGVSDSEVHVPPEFVKIVSQCYVVFLFCFYFLYFLV